MSMTAYDLPTSLTIGEVSYPIRYGWRAILDIFSAFSDPELDDEMRMTVMIQILYPEWKKIPAERIPEAAQKAMEFIDCGQKPKEGKKHRVMDWEQDGTMIIPAVNQIAGREVRMDPNIHWWTFFGWYMSIGDSLFSSVLRVRSKKAEGKKLDKWEEQFYRNNKSLVDLQRLESEEIQKEKQDMLKWL